MSTVAGKVYVVTGAASGIGRALAQELAARGARGLAISDVDETGLAETEALLGGTEVDAARLDVADRSAWEAYAQRVTGRFGVVHQIYNNAGIADSDPVEAFEIERYERMLSINLWGVIYGTKAFLPHLIASGDGAVVNISSLNGIMAQAEMSAYCTAKFGVRGFTESLALELEAERRPVRATVVHPGGISTEIANSALAHAEASGREITDDERRRHRIYNEQLLRMPPRGAAAIIVDGVEAGRRRVLVGNDARAMDALVRMLPAHWPKLFRVIERVIERRAGLSSA